MGLFGPAWKTSDSKKLDKALAAVERMRGDLYGLRDVALKAPLDEVASAACATLPGDSEYLAEVTRLSTRGAVIEAALRQMATCEGGEKKMLAIALDPNDREPVQKAIAYLIPSLDGLKTVRDKAPSQEVRDAADERMNDVSAAGSERTDPDALVEFARNADSLVRLQVAGNAIAPLRLLAAMTRDPDSSVRKEIAKNSTVVPSILADLAQDESVSVRLAVAKNPTTPQDALAHLATDTDVSVRQEVAKNPSTPSEALARLANDEDSFVRERVADNEHTPPEVLVRLADDDDDDVCYEAVCNASLPLDVLMGFAECEDDRQVAAAANRAMPAHILAELAERDDLELCEVLARNPSTPPEALARFVLDEDMDRFVRIDAVQNPSTPFEVLQQLLEDDEFMYEYDYLFDEMAMSPDTSPATLVGLYRHDPESYWRVTIARNPSCPSDLMVELLETGDEDIQTALAENPSSPPEVLAELALAKSWTTRMEVACNHGTSPETLAALAADVDSGVRLWAARNPSTPLSVVEALTHDEEDIVREYAIPAYRKRTELGQGDVPRGKADASSKNASMQNNANAKIKKLK